MRKNFLFIPTVEPELETWNLSFVRQLLYQLSYPILLQILFPLLQYLGWSVLRLKLKLLQSAQVTIV